MTCACIGCADGLDEVCDECKYLDQRKKEILGDKKWPNQKNVTHPTVIRWQINFVFIV